MVKAIGRRAGISKVDKLEADDAVVGKFDVRDYLGSSALGPQFFG